MKFIFSLIFLLSISSAQACPDLSGTFQCSIDPDEAGDTGVIHIKTLKANDDFIYVVQDQDSFDQPISYLSDNKEYQMADGSTYRGWCEDDEFKYTQYELDQHYGEIRGDVVLKLDVSHNLITHGTLVFAGKQYESKDTCKKL